MATKKASTLMKSVENDDDVGNNNEELLDNEEDEFRQASKRALEQQRLNNTWKDGGVRKDIVIRVLIQCFSTMVESYPRDDAIPDYNGKYKSSDMIHRKMLDASKQVVKAKKTLLKNENFDNRDFTLFIASKKWVADIVRPLLELCANDDSNLALNCCGLVLVLIRRLSDRTIKALSLYKKKKPRVNKDKTSLLTNTSTTDPTTNKDDENVAAMKNKDSDEEDMDMDIDDFDNITNTADILRNSIQQLSALVSFKEALCSEKCNLAVTNAFREFWMSEQLLSTDDNKLGVAICLSYFRRILAITTHPDWSSPAEIINHQLIHERYIVQLRVILSVLPGICSDLRRNYHDEWLADVIQLIYYIVVNYDPQDMFLVWKSNGIIQDFVHSTQIDTTTSTTDSTDPTTATTSKLADKVTNNTNTVAVPTTITKQFADEVLQRGKLSQLLHHEKNLLKNKLTSSRQVNRFSKFSSTYRIPIATNTATATNTTKPTTNTSDMSNKDTNLDFLNPGSNTTDTNTDTVPGINPPTKCIPSTAIIVNNIFKAPNESNIPDIKAKKNKKHLTFAQENTYINQITNKNNKLSLESQQALVVATSLVEALSQEACLKQFVLRINEDLRRDEMKIGPELEKDNYKILKTSQTVGSSEESGANPIDSHTAAASSAGVVVSWSPQLRNVIDSLDRMSFNRVIASIERSLKLSATNTNNTQANAFHVNNNHYSTIHNINNLHVGNNVIDASGPILLYMEMLQYIRIMLESSLDIHHEIAIAALHRLFYCNYNERMDPLEKLLRHWKPAIFSRKHTCALIGLVQETLRTLETAKNLFVSQGITTEEKLYLQHKLKQKKNKNGEKNNSKRVLDMEQYLLAAYRFDVYDYFKRLVNNNNIRLYTRILATMKSNDKYINHCLYSFLQRLYNFIVLDDNDIDGDGEGYAITTTMSQMNHEKKVNLAFLFFNIHSLLVINDLLADESLSFDPMYQPILRLLKVLIRRFGELARENPLLLVECLFSHPRAQQHYLHIHSHYEASVHDPHQPSYIEDSDSEEDSDIDEDESNTKKKKVDDDLGDEIDEDELRPSTNPATNSAAVAKKQRKKKSTTSSDPAATKVKKAGTNRKIWTEEEDKVLRELYQIYAGTRSIFIMIADSDEMKAFNKKRNANHIEKRVKELKLHLLVTDHDSDEDNVDVPNNNKKAKGGNSDNEDSEEEEVTQKQDDLNLDDEQYFRGLDSTTNTKDNASDEEDNVAPEMVESTAKQDDNNILDDIISTYKDSDENDMDEFERRSLLLERFSNDIDAQEQEVSSNIATADATNKTSKKRLSGGKSSIQKNKKRRESESGSDINDDSSIDDNAMMMESNAGKNKLTSTSRRKVLESDDEE